ncbi:MAG: flagellar hook-basal body complex protein FliE [Solirubrobacteraceae bacterium]
MIVPAVGGLAGKLSEGLINSAAAPQANGLGQAGQGLGNTGLEGSGGLQGASGIEGAGGASGIEGASGLEGTSGIEGAGGIGSSGLEGTGGVQTPNFGNELTGAISSLEGTQQSAAGAAQSLAGGTATDPESAVVTVQDAQMAMDLAATIRTKATEAAQSIFQTQV